ncbi:glutamate 5-kinase [uncultured Psychrosphaera sp.]|uniref:glutamate 5-kinase n=1 Tax=uncultured Psychrosphaera sp. TaxID=1403522 RepID=UPI0026084D79|nr:glutamate 5-kinase [uncultured Psychrosphaera sp.]
MNTQNWTNWQRAVIKVGSALIAPNGDQVSDQYILPIAQFINESRLAGKEVIIVSSGSVAAGRNEINCHDQGVTIAEKQAMAAVGQVKMMENWQRCFDVSCAQLLITHGDLRDRRRYVNIKNTVRELLINNIIPIINENDTVATQEIKVGDNDNLAALVALVSDADVLFICSDIDGLYDADPKTNRNAKLLPSVDAITKDIYALAGDTQNKIATGGMITKLQAAEKTTNNGINTFIVNGKNENTFSKLSNNQHVGTWFKAVNNKDSAKKQWLQYTLHASGKLVIDEGAQAALLGNGASLLAKGIVSAQGDFVRGDAIDIEYNNEIIARGLSQYSKAELALILGKDSAEFESILGFRLGSKHTEEIIHRDDLVLFNS